MIPGMDRLTGPSPVHNFDLGGSLAKVSPDDREIIRKQLGRAPRGLLEVSARCSYGYPVVIKTKPLIKDSEEDFEVFPTLYWLTGPKRREEVAKIESSGYIEQLEKELNSDQDLKKKYNRNEGSYLDEQRKLLSREEENFLKRKGALGALERGIGGIKSDEHIKCLHLHLAHQIADENVIGALLQERFSFEDCPPDDVICDKY